MRLTAWFPQVYLAQWFLSAQVFDYSHWMRLADLFPRQFDGWVGNQNGSAFYRKSKYREQMVTLSCTHRSILSAHVCASKLLSRFPRSRFFYQPNGLAGAGTFQRASPQCVSVF